MIDGRERRGQESEVILYAIERLTCISFYRTKRKEKTSERNSIGRRNKQLISFIHTFR